MKTKHVYIFTGDGEKDFKFRNKDVEENFIDERNVFVDASFENAFKRDVAQGFGGWDKVRMLDSNGREVSYLRTVGKDKKIHDDEVMLMSEVVKIREEELKNKKEAEKNNEYYY